MSKYGEPWKTSRPTECDGAFAYLDRADAAFPGDTATFWSVSGDALEHADHAKACVNFAAGVTIPEGPDAPKLSGVLESLSWATALLSLRESTWEPGGPAETAFKKARTLLAAFQPVEPEETSDGR